MKRKEREFFVAGQAYMKRHQRDVYPVANPRGDEAERKLYTRWKAYFAWLGWTPVMFNELRDNPARKGFTLPCEYPSDLDVTYPEPDRDTLGGAAARTML